jgi:excisionase family DNA binding protein
VRDGEQLAFGVIETVSIRETSEPRRPALAVEPGDRATAGRSTPQTTFTPAPQQGRGTGKPGAVPRVTLSVDEAAAALAVSRDHFERHVLSQLRVVYSGRRRLIPLRELERWVEREAVPARTPTEHARRS